MRFFVLLLLLLNTVPFIATWLIALDSESDRVRNTLSLFFILLCDLTINGSIFYIVYRRTFHRPVLSMIIDIITMQCTYQDVERMATILIICLIIATLLGCFLNIVISHTFPKISKKKRIFYLLGITILFIPIIFAYKISYFSSSYIKIIEVCRKSSVMIDGEENESGSYVEISNTGILKVELNSLFLANNEELENSTCYTQRLVIWPGQSFRLLLSDDDSVDLKKDGGSILYLCDENNNIMDWLTIPALKRDESYKYEGNEWHVVDNKVEIKVLNNPEFSAESGFYDEPFYLSITVPEGEYVYYTLDGSIPAANAQLYTEPIYVYDKSSEENKYRNIINVRKNYYKYAKRGQTPVDKCFVVRAVAINQEGDRSDVVTYTYFVDKNEYKEGIVLSLVSDPDGLFGDDGICVTGAEYDAWYEENYQKELLGETIDDTDAPKENYMQRGGNWERDANLEMFKDTESVLNLDVGIRVQGHSSRQAIQKRFSLYARKKYSDSKWFPENLLNEYRQHIWLLRKGDKNAISQKLGQGRDVAAMSPVKVRVFLDGEYWYEVFLNDKLSRNNIAEIYGLTADNVSICKNGRGANATGRNTPNEGPNPFSGIYEYIGTNDLADMKNYEEYNKIIDIQSFIDASCIQSILANLDYEEKWNNMVWHTVIWENDSEGDTRWRWALCDMDLAWDTLDKQFGDLMPYEINPYQMYGTHQKNVGPTNEWDIYKALKANEKFCEQYVITFMDLLNSNFSADNIQRIMEELDITDENIQMFFERRAEYVIPYMAEEFNLQGSLEKVTVSSSEKNKAIQINTICVNTDDIWTGIYFTDYPISLFVDDDTFSHWEVITNGEKQTFYSKEIKIPVLEGGMEINAVFE